MATHLKRRIPELRFTSLRGIGWHVSFRDRKTGQPRRVRFNLDEKDREAEARVLYHTWLACHLGNESETQTATSRPPARTKRASNTQVLSGCILEIASSLLQSERVRSRKGDEPRRQGTIDHQVFLDRKNKIQKFLEFLNERHGANAVSRLRLADLSMEDVEAFNRSIVKEKYSASQVAKHLQIVKAIIDRGGRPEHKHQVLTWNWDSRDVTHGAPTRERVLPTVKQLEKLLAATDLRGQTMIWLGIGLGFGARDLSSVRVGQISQSAYDLRRTKTGIERFGTTPPLVWTFVKKYQAETKRSGSDLLFVGRNGLPLVHSTKTGVSNAVVQWWDRLRVSIDETNESLGGFYTLRHLGATEFGSRPGASIGDVKRWLGHSASSDVADLYMRPVSPEHHDTVEWVRRRLLCLPEPKIKKPRRKKKR